MLLLLIILSLSQASLLFGFKWLNFTFNNSVELEAYTAAEIYKDCIPTGLEVNSKGDFFLSIPRNKSSRIPATFTKLTHGETQPILSPFPSWWENSESNPYGFGSITVFEIDLNDNFWLVDNQRSLLIKMSVDGFLLEEFSLEAAISLNSSISDISLDLDRNFAYLSDPGTPGLIVINLNTRDCNMYLRNHYSVSPDISMWLTIGGTRVLKNNKMLSLGIGGISLSCDKRDLYYSPVSSVYLFAIATQYLREEVYRSNHSKYVVNLGYKNTASQGLTISEKGDMYLTDLQNSNVYYYQQMAPYYLYFLDYFLKPTLNESNILWPYSVTFDNNKRSLLVLANQIQNFWDRSINFLNPLHGEFNFWVFEKFVNDRNYFHRCQDVVSAQSLPQVPVWIYMLGTVLFLIVLTLAICGAKHYQLIRRRKKDLIFS